MRKHAVWRCALLCAMLLTASMPFAFNAPAQAHGAAATTTVTQDWPTFLHDVARTSASTEAILNTSNVTLLKKQWAYLTGGGIAASPTIVNGIVYVGSWDGYEYAINAKTGALVWKTFLGQTTAPNCAPATIGITSAAAVINGVVYVGGGDANWYALDPNTGAVLWKVFTGDNSATGGHYNWSSPLIYNNDAYIGIASNCDQPLVQGQLLEVDLTTHLVVNTANFVPNGDVGGGIWTSPTLDTATNTIFVTTGTLATQDETMAQAVVSLDASTLAIKDHWQIPINQRVNDSDWGTTPILVSDSTGRQLVVAANKNGLLYAFLRSNLSAGPVWEKRIANGGSCPQCGDGAISSGTFANGVLYYAAGNITVNGVGYAGTVNALDPATGNVLWMHGDVQPIFAGISYDNGLIIDGVGSTLEVLDASNGVRLYSYTTAAPIYSAPSVSGGRIYFGSVDKHVYSLGLGAATTIAPDTTCPTGWTCQDINNSKYPGSESLSNGTWSVAAAGAGIKGGTDQFRLISQPATGDTQVTAQLLTEPTTSSTAQTGVIMRQSNDPGSPFYAVLEYANDAPDGFASPTLRVQYRTAFGGAITQASRISPTNLPVYVMIQRTGDAFLAATSSDGVNYQAVPGSRAVLPLPATVLAGNVVDSGSATTYITDTYAQPTIGAPSTQIAQAAMPSPCPTNWNCYDVGNTAPVGSQTVSSTGQWTLLSTGTTIGGYADQFHFVYQNLAGDGSIQAHVVSQTNTAAGARAGVMLRQSLDPGSAYYGVFVTPGNGIIVQYRTVTGLRSILGATIAGTAPVYLKITRYTATTVSPSITYYAAYTSSDGVNWTFVPWSTAAINMGGTMLAGMVASTYAAATQSTVVMDTVSLSSTTTPPPTLCPTSWSCNDVGYPDTPGAQSLINGVWTLQSPSSDIWGTLDEFRFDSQPVAGNGSVSAHVTAQSNSDPWAKAGVMLRATTAPDAPYYAALVTPGNGLIVQYRAASGGSTSQLKFTGAAPTYLQVARYTDTNATPITTYFTAYTSTDGVAWTPLAGSTISTTLTGAIQGGLAATSHNTAVAGTASFDTVSVSATATPPPTACPTAYSCTDIGGATPAGSQSLSNGSWTVVGGGSDIWNTADSFHFVSQAFTSDGMVSARVGSQTVTDPWAKAGVMIRASTDPGSPYYAFLATPSNGLAVQYRTAQGGTTSQLSLAGTVPTYLAVAQNTVTTTTPATVYYTAYTSTDGVTWTLVTGSKVALNLTSTPIAGMAVTSHNTNNLSSVVFNNFTVSQSTPPPPQTCPTSWTCGDIGGATPGGTESLNAGAWSIQGGGSDIYGTADSFHFVSQALTADGSISAHLTSQTNTSAWAKAGVMLRATNDPGSAYYAALITPGNGLVIQYRSASGAGTSSIQFAGTTVPVYLQVARYTDTSTTPATIYFTAYTSTDGVTWTALANSTVSFAMTGAIQAGMAVTSHNSSALSTAAMDTVAISTTVSPPPASPCPTSWTCGDIGGATPLGSQTLNAGAWSIQGGGSDIYGAADSFHFVSQALTADGSISAHLTSQTNTSAWAKAGVMLRATNDPGSAYYAALITPGNGLVIQYRSASGAGTTQAAQITGATTPTYLKVTRSGTTFTAYSSTDGVTWTLVAGSTVTLTNLSGSLLAGMAVTSHNTGALSTVAFDTVTVG